MLNSFQYLSHKQEILNPDVRRDGITHSSNIILPDTSLLVMKHSENPDSHPFLNLLPAENRNWKNILTLCFNQLMYEKI